MKITTEYVREEVKKRGYKLIGEYINAKTKITLEDEEGYLYSITWSDFKSGREPHMVHINNPYSIDNIRKYALKFGYELISNKYVNSNTKLTFKCPKCGELFNIRWSSFQQGKRCGVCTGNQVTLKTCIATTDPWMMKYLKNKEDGYNYSHGSSKKVEVICPYCGKEKKIIISDFYRYKNICCSCGDGTSYPEKILISILDQLNIKNVKEYIPQWIDNGRRYDFYLPDFSIIIECHGIQHYKHTGFNRTLREEQKNDDYKVKIAYQNGIDNYIVLDCRESNIEWIKNSILDSELNNLFNLSNSNINWQQCEEFALSNRVKQVCDYWHIHNDINHENLTTTDIGKVFNLNQNTICRYLKKGKILQWCTTYNPKEEDNKNRKKNHENKCKPVMMLKDGKFLGVFKSSAELERQSEELFGVKLFNQSISNVCRGKSKHHRGYTFKFITQLEYNQYQEKIS